MPLPQTSLWDGVVNPWGMDHPKEVRRKELLPVCPLLEALRGKGTLSGP